MVDHRRCEHQAPQGEDIDNICYGTLKPIREEDTFKLLPVLYRPEPEDREKQRSKDSSGLRDHGRSSQREKHSRHRDRSRSREHQPRQSCIMKESSPKKRKDSPSIPPEDL